MQEKSSKWNAKATATQKKNYCSVAESKWCYAYDTNTKKIMFQFSHEACNGSDIQANLVKRCTKTFRHKKKSQDEHSIKPKY